MHETLTALVAFLTALAFLLKEILESLPPKKNYLTTDIDTSLFHYFAPMI